MTGSFDSVDALLAHARRSIRRHGPADLEGGIRAWGAAGLPVVDGGTPVEQVVPG